MVTAKKSIFQPAAAWFNHLFGDFQDPSIKVVGHFFAIAYVCMAIVCAGFLGAIKLVPDVAIFGTALLLSYAFIYLLPAILLTKAVQCFLLWRQRRQGELATWQRVLIYALALTGTTVALLLTISDRIIYKLFSFHLNGFVWNLITTPGGIESMGGSASTTRTFVLLVVAIILGLAGLLWWLHRRACRQPEKESKSLPRWVSYRYGLVLIVLLSLSERGWYGISKLRDDTPILVAADAFPFYLPTSFRSAAKRLGYTPKHVEHLHAETSLDNLRYPAKPLEIVRPQKPYNIVWLMAESWRADMLDPEIMPATSAFSEQAIHAENHYSSGNGTRMGIFGMFYSLYGPYWFSFLKEKRGPVIVDVLQQEGYDLQLFTSSSFKYPEFDKTVWSQVPPARLQPTPGGANWERDRKNVKRLLESIDERPPDKPFMRFMFFESPHARYYFPPECAIRKPYLEDFNYLTMDPQKDMPLIHNRYVNACNHLDTQFKRIIDYLREHDLLDTTIVVMAGDHGEEFMEKNHWGHNSNFTEEQTRTPLILWIPGQAPQTITRLTSHLDVVPTLMPLLGVKQPPADYCLGYNLLADTVRPYTVIADWSNIAYVEDDNKAVIPLNLRAALNNQVTDGDDKAVEDPSAFMTSHQTQLVQVMKDLKRFF